MANAQVLKATGSAVVATDTNWVDVATIAAASFDASTEYLIFAWAVVQNASSANELKLRLVHGGTPTLFTDADAIEEIVAGTTRTQPGWLVRFSQPGTTELVKIQASSSSTTDVTVDFAQIIAIRLSDLGAENTKWWWNEVTADLTLTTSYQDGASETFTGNASDKYLYLAQAVWIPGSATAQTDVALVVDGNIRGLASEEGEDTATEQRSRLFMWAEVPTAASHTVKVQAKGETAGGTVLSSRVFVLNLSAVFAQASVSNSTATTSLVEGAGWINLANVSLNVATTGDFFIIGAMEQFWNAATNADPHGRMQHNNSGSFVSAPNYGDHGLGVDTWDGTDHRILFLADTVALTSGGVRTVNLDGLMFNTGTADPSVINRALALFSVELVASGPSNQNVTGVGAIATGEAVGTMVLSPGPVTVSAVGAIAGAEAFGTLALSAIARVTAIGAIASAEALGTPTITVGPVTVTGIGAIASAEALGTMTITRGVVNVTAVGGIGSGEAFGVLTVTAVAAITGLGAIGTGEAFGTPVITPGPVNVTAIGGVGSAEAFGTLVVQAGVQQVSAVGGIAGAEAFGTLIVSPGAVSVTSVGAIGSGEAFGLTVVSAVAAVSNVGGVGSAEAFGTLVVSVGGVSVTGIGAITSAEGFGTLTVSQAGGGAQFVSAFSIAFDSAMGTVVVAAGPVNVALEGIPSTEAFGTLQIVGISQVSLQGIPTSETFGSLVIGLYVSALGAIVSGESFPLPIISSSYSLLSLGNIVSEEAFGTLVVEGGAIIYDPEPFVEVERIQRSSVIIQKDPFVQVIGGKSYVEVERG